ncbi:hypothetical protein FKM82_025587 [Ascaphus truei]
MSFLRWVSDRILVDGLRELEFFREPHLGDLRKTTDEAASAESVACCRGPDAMGIYTPDGSCYELLTMIGEKPAPRSASGPDPNVGLSHR